MNLSAKSRALLERMRPTIESASPDEIARAVNANELSPWRDGPLALAHDGSFRAFFAPLDWINDDADIIIVGVTPGKQQALEALLTFRNTLPGLSLSDPRLDDRLLLRLRKKFESRREQRLHGGSNGRIVPTTCAASLDQVTQLPAIVWIEVHIAQQTKQSAP